MIFSSEYHYQYAHVVNELIENPDGRRAEMIYNRPSIWTEFDKNGMSDFICTNAVTYYIRDNLIHCVVQMRSNDVVFGYKNDFAWQSWVLKSIRNTINEKTDDSNLSCGDIHWQVQNLHVYEKHFSLVQ